MSEAQVARYRSLDGLRGVASFVVLGYHALLIVPAVSALYVAHANPALLSPEWWLYATPLRLLFAGHEAVLVFFVLSGFVLTLPFLSRPPTGRSTLAYYGRRIVRLYLPVWASLVVALALALAVPRQPGPTWLGSHHAPTVGTLWHDAILVLGTSNLNSPLWSLTWEVWFSLLMPLMYLVIRFARADRWWWAAIPVLIAVSALSRFAVVRQLLPAAWLTDDLLQYLPVFAIGMIVAFNRDGVSSAAASVRHWWPVVAAALLLTVAPSIAAPNGSYGVRQSVVYAASLIGVTVILCLAFASPARRPLETRPVQWAGTRSFSIYLVHEPILVAVALLVGASGWWWVPIAALTIPVILVVAELFYRLVERPSIALSRTVGRALSARPVPAAAEPRPAVTPDAG
ncbi:acyltransferase family protein [Leifsonia sp. 22587]|uniref:acyltransferase family protein n=1 Tax=Leifsonia sp. 22587 TaxID=3453946 RepID=UPI003F86F43A